MIVTFCKIDVTRAMERILTFTIWHWRLSKTAGRTSHTPWSLILKPFVMNGRWRIILRFAIRDQLYGHNLDRAPSYWKGSGALLTHKLALADCGRSKVKDSSYLRQRILNTALTWDRFFSIGRNRAKTKYGLDLNKKPHALTVVFDLTLSNICVLIAHTIPYH